ncbi:MULTISPECIES: SLC13 family permease [Rhodococcus]|uniref:SLC13 family permease n=1 Tax=Rhodococcus TaxID=1827 RepID=UPI001F453A38|nr:MULTISPECIES: SLC13 family permease [Rhodococcus]MCZ4617062.1 ArsB/NhaD family transporter [Rhodococcus qingshengii]MDT9664310.1 ArsB/NhaD family transporter [Rhodococcus qingshengii]UXF65174.1 SLC13 family permease [Rhodococcus qingshengii]WCT00483.1 ArsB/NhaD family transporter [Rhodococcus qingshengii]WEX03749.1 ArsB/NhaD family transporter [Rhodococcus sp. RCBS9]
MTLLPILLVALVLVFAIVRPRGLPEIVIAGPAAVVVLLTGVVTLDEARDELASMAPTVVFLVAVLVLAHAADALGVFRWVSQILQQKSLADPHRLLIYVFGAAALTTAVLSLDATVVLLTPAVIAAARSIGASTRPHSYASAHLSNSASTLLPVSNLTNLIAFAATGLTFLHFTALMALPWVVTIAVEYLIFRLFFRSELARGDSAEPPVAARSAPAPILPLTVIGMTLLGFAVSGFFGIEPAWIAVVGASVLGAIALARHRTTAAKMLYAADLWFCAFVLVLGIIVAGVANGPVGEWIAQILPGDTSYGSLLFVAAVAAVASNLVNNLPATLLMIAALGTAAPPALVLAMLIGVNLGPNLTYVGSLATMLWRRVATSAGAPPTLATFTLLGVITTPLTLLAAVSALWLVI